MFDAPLIAGIAGCWNTVCRFIANESLFARATLWAILLVPLSAEAGSRRDTSDYPADPRPIVVEFFRDIRADAPEAAWKCWNSYVPEGKDEKYEHNQIRNAIAEWIATYQLEQALKKKLPQVYEVMKAQGELTPTPSQISNAKVITFRRLAIIRWGDDEDAGLPLVLDTNAKPPRWLISLSHYRETTRSSVGDSFQATDAVAKAINDVTKDVLHGNIKSTEALGEAQLRHLNEELQKLTKEKP